MLLRTLKKFSRAGFHSVYMSVFPSSGFVDITDMEVCTVIPWGHASNIYLRYIRDVRRLFIRSYSYCALVVVLAISSIPMSLLHGNPNLRLHDYHRVALYDTAVVFNLSDIGSIVALSPPMTANTQLSTCNLCIDLSCSLCAPLHVELRCGLPVYKLWPWTAQSIYPIFCLSLSWFVTL